MLLATELQVILDADGVTKADPQHPLLRKETQPSMLQDCKPVCRPAMASRIKLLVALLGRNLRTET